MVRATVLRIEVMKEVLPCAIYTRKSSEEGLEQGFNSLDAQREACEAFILSQKTQGWKAIDTNYDDGGFSGGNTERPALQKLLADIAAKRVRIVVVYKVDRLTRSLADFAKLVELFDAHGVSFVSVTQQFNTTSSMGRLTLNVLLSFAQFEREVTGERIRDKIAASKRKGMWMGGFAPVGYVPDERTLVIDEPQAQHIREIYRLYLELGCVSRLRTELEHLGWHTPLRKTQRDDQMGDKPFSRGHLYRILSNPIYLGKIVHKGTVFAGNHPAIVDEQLWQAVQDRLGSNLKRKRTRSSAADPSLLAGMVFDDHGNRLTPTHTKKGSKHYRYYVTHELITNVRKAAAEGLRLPARELEEVVLQGLVELMKNEGRLVELMDGLDTTEFRRRLNYAADVAKQLSEGSQSDRIAILVRILDRVIIHKQNIKVIVRNGGLWSDDHVPENDEATTSLDVPVQLKRCGMAVRLIVKAPGHTSNRKPDATLIALLAKAHNWFAKLSSGECDGVKAIAKQKKVGSSYVTRVIHLAFLDPGIVQKILQGAHPPELSADRLIRMVPLPENWEEQRKLLGLNV
jgi:site-specific DNA recombinase